MQVPWVRAEHRDDLPRRGRTEPTSPTSQPGVVYQLDCVYRHEPLSAVTFAGEHTRGDHCLDAATAHTELLGCVAQRDQILQHASTIPRLESLQSTGDRIDVSTLHGSEAPVRVAVTIDRGRSHPNHGDDSNRRNKHENERHPSAGFRGHDAASPKITRVCHPTRSPMPEGTVTQTGTVSSMGPTGEPRRPTLGDSR
jgi:hypothetical protein